MGFKEQFDFSRGEQLAVTALLIMLLLFIGISFFPLSIPVNPVFSDHQLDSVLSLHKSAQAHQEQHRKEHFDAVNPDYSAAADRLNPFIFNPNKLPESDWKKLGLQDNQIRNIKNYEQKGGRFFRKEDLKKIYSITATEYEILEPFIVIPIHGNVQLAKAVMKSENKVRKAVSAEKRQAVRDVELNSADSLDLIQLPQVGPWFAHRILRYREILGGYIHQDQLLEVYGMDKERLDKFVDYLTIDTANIDPLRINFVDFKQVVRHPYFSYGLTKAVFNYRERTGMIANWEILQQLVPKADSLSVYLPKYLQYN
ncbi:MAG: helix-hairpin-helix domain-containing protein [Bacteroidales bacterium]|nr:helix-hairpin-helix domain-containing protein [Bacteroidales bacterium]